MGYMKHHAIVVTSWNDELLQEVHAKAMEIFDQVAPITPPVVNGYVSFLIAPDGSKEGWPDSHIGDYKRKEFIAWVDSKRYDDGDTAVEYVEVQFGDDEENTKIIRHSDDHIARVRKSIFEAIGD
ncbi:hypothetical protein KAR91_65255 [Candidatus Pacearchaeota archaeon]|nr:hypothetical protein [Candidatus Pacearchaeota archaeon]